MSELTANRPVLVYRAFLIFTFGLMVWSLYAQYQARRWVGGRDLLADDLWQIGFTTLWYGSAHAMMLLAALVALLFRSGAAVWLYALALTYTVVPNLLTLLFEGHHTAGPSALLTVSLLAHVAIVAWALRYLVRNGEIRTP